MLKGGKLSANLLDALVFFHHLLARLQQSKRVGMERVCVRERERERERERG